MQFTWAKRNRDGASRVEWVGRADSREVWIIWQHFDIHKGKRKVGFFLIRASTDHLIGSFPSLAAAKAKAEKLGE